MTTNQETYCEAYDDSNRGLYPNASMSSTITMACYAKDIYLIDGDHTNDN